MAPPLLFVRDVAMRFGSSALLDGAELSVAAGERVALVGRNGSGKSTLMKIAAGSLEADRAERFVHPGASIRYLAQEPDFSAFTHAHEVVEAGVGPGDAHRARRLLEELALDPDALPSSLSGGETRRLALAQSLAADPDILMLDEPTNHLDVATIEWLERRLAARRGALVMISHDRRFLETLSRTTVWLDRGRTRRLDAGFARFEAWRDEMLEEEERDAHKLDRKIAAEEHWMRHGVTARRKRNMRRVAELAGLREKRRTRRRAEGAAVMTAGEAEQSGALQIEARDLAKAFDGRTIVGEFSLRVMRGDRLGVVGPNGSGKTTLVQLLTGALPPDGGTVRHGANVQFVVLDQLRATLDPEATLAEALTGGRGDTVFLAGAPRHVVGYMQDFLFAPEQARSPLSVLSGGERARVALARALVQPANVLVLDEPTNDLDLETLDVLEELLSAYAGTVVLISHDRDFLDRVVTSVLAPEGDGRWIEYAGGYADMLAQRGADLSRSAPRRPETAKASSRADATPPRAAPARKLSFKDQHALASLPGEIEALQREIARLRGELADPGLYVRDRAQFAAVTDALTAATQRLEAAEERWLELEMRREALQSR